jgi:predicted nuclease with TOPRIM domain
MGDFLMNFFTGLGAKTLLPLALTGTLIAGAATYTSFKTDINSNINGLKQQVTTLKGYLEEANWEVREANDANYVFSARGQDKINKLQDEIVRLNNELKAANSEVDRLGVDLTSGNDRIETGSAEMNKANASIELANQDQAEIKQLSSEALSENASYVASASAKQFTSSSLVLETEFATNLVEVTRVNDNDNSTVDPIRVYNKTILPVTVSVDGGSTTVEPGKVVYFKLTPKTWVFQLSGNGTNWSKTVNNLQ